MKQKNIFLVAAALLIAVFLAGAFFYQRHSAEQAQQLAAQNLAKLNRAHAPTFGDPKAAVHIVEFFDPACGTCREFYPLVKHLMDSYPGRVRLSLRYAPFHPGSDQVVKVLEAARAQGQFAAVLEVLFAAQGEWVVNHMAQVDRIWAPLARAGLDVERLKNGMNAPEIAGTMAQDLDDAKALNVTMTPEYFVNGKPLPSFGFEQLKNLVEEALLHANAN